MNTDDYRPPPRGQPTQGVEDAFLKNFAKEIPADEQKEKVELKHFSLIKAAFVTVINPLNLVRGVKIGFMATAATVLAVASHIIGVVSSSGKTLMKQRVAELHDRSAHNLYKITQAWVRQPFGDRLLVTTRNIGTLEVLAKQEEIKNEIKKMVEDKFTKDPLPGKGKVKLPDIWENDIKEKLQSNEVTTRTREGVCYATTMCLIRDYLKQNKTDNTAEKILTRIAKESTKGVSKEICALQAFFEAFPESFTENEKENVDVAFGRYTKEEIASRRLASDPNYFEVGRVKSSELAVAHVVGLKPNIERTQAMVKEKLNSTKKEGIIEIDQPNNYFDTKTQLEKGGFSQLQNGAYQLTFKIGELDTHSIAFIREEKESFLFDPNIGLIKCGDNPIQDLLDLLSRYPAPAPTYRNEGPNYGVSVIKYEANEQG